MATKDKADSVTLPGIEEKFTDWLSEMKVWAELKKEDKTNNLPAAAMQASNVKSIIESMYTTLDVADQSEFQQYIETRWFEFIFEYSGVTETQLVESYNSLRTFLQMKAH